MPDWYLGRPVLSEDGRVLQARLEEPRGTRELFWESEGQRLREIPEAFLPVVLLVASLLGGDVHSHAPVTPGFAANWLKYQDRLLEFRPSLHRIRLHAEIREPLPAANPPREVLFFSGGVDSSYLLGVLRPRLHALISVHGFDVKPGDATAWNHLHTMLAGTAGQMGLPLWILRTNIRDVSRGLRPHVADPWSYGYPGALAGAGHALGGEASGFHIAGSRAIHQYDGSFVCHPELNPLWSSESVAFLADPDEPRRFDKVAYILKHQPQMIPRLRVCVKDKEWPLNCGRCKKCIGTTLELLSLQAPDPWRSFKKRARPADIVQVPFFEGINHFAREAIGEMLRQKSYPRFTHAGQVAFARPPAWFEHLRQRLLRQRGPVTDRMLWWLNASRLVWQKPARLRV